MYRVGPWDKFMADGIGITVTKYRDDPSVGIKNTQIWIIINFENIRIFIVMQLGLIITIHSSFVRAQSG